MRLKSISVPWPGRSRQGNTSLKKQGNLQWSHDSTAVKLIIDPETGQFVDANKRACDYYGYDRDTPVPLYIRH